MRFFCWPVSFQCKLHLSKKGKWNRVNWRSFDPPIEKKKVNACCTHNKGKADLTPHQLFFPSCRTYEEIQRRRNNFTWNKRSGRVVSLFETFIFVRIVVWRKEQFICSVPKNAYTNDKTVSKLNFFKMWVTFLLILQEKLLEWKIYEYSV